MVPLLGPQIPFVAASEDMLFADESLEALFTSLHRVAIGAMVLFLLLVMMDGKGFRKNMYLICASVYTLLYIHFPVYLLFKLDYCTYLWVE